MYGHISMPPKRKVSAQGPDAAPATQKSKTKQAKIQHALENVAPLIRSGMNVTLPREAFVKTMVQSSKAASAESHRSVSTAEVCNEANILLCAGSIKAEPATHPSPRHKSILTNSSTIIEVSGINDGD